jgi:hypothetical protein
MTTIKQDSEHTENVNKETDQPPRRSDLGWEGHVHFPEGIPLWRRVLESWPELRTGLAYSLVFGAGVLLGSAVSTMLACRENKSEG